MPVPVVHFEITASDAGKSKAFYSKLFDWSFQTHEGFDYHLVGPANDKSIGGGLGPVQEGQSPMLTFYVQVDDLQKYLDKAEGLGGKTVLPPTPIPGVGSCAMFTDPDGLVIGLFKGQQ